MNKRGVFDEAFKETAVELSNAKGSVQQAARELGIDPGQISKWRQCPRFANPAQLLRHGATGKVRLTNTVPNAVLVPQKAVFEQQDKNYVYVVDGQGLVHQKNFVPKTRLSAFYVVQSGLKPGEQVVCDGIQDLRDGNRIKSQPVTMNSLAAAQ